VQVLALLHSLLLQYVRTLHELRALQLVGYGDEALHPVIEDLGGPLRILVRELQVQEVRLQRRREARHQASGCLTRRENPEFHLTAGGEKLRRGLPDESGRRADRISDGAAIDQLAFHRESVCSTALIYRKPVVAGAHSCARRAEILVERRILAGGRLEEE